MAVKKPETMFKNFTHALADRDLCFLFSRMHYLYQDDLAEGLNYLDTLKNEQGDINPASYLFDNAKNSEDFNTLLDMFSFSLMREYEKRGFRLEQLI